MRVFVATLLGAATLNTAFVVFGRGSFDHLAGVFMLVLYVAVPFGVAGLLSLLAVADSRARFVGRWAFVVAVVAGSTMASLPFGAAVHEFDVEEAKAYFESLTPRLEEYRTTNGAYPRYLSAVSEGSARPTLLRESGYYHSDGLTYSFSFSSGFLEALEYDSQSKAWSKVD